MFSYCKSNESVRPLGEVGTMRKEIIKQIIEIESKEFQKTQNSIDESFGDDGYKLKTDDQLMKMVGDFGFGGIEFHTADVERLRTEKENWKYRYGELLNNGIKE